MNIKKDSAQCLGVRLARESGVNQGTKIIDTHCAVTAPRGSSCALSAVRGTPGGHARQLFWRAEFDRDVLLSLDGPIVQESGLESPQANGADCSRKQRERPADAFYVQYFAEFSDGGADLYSFRRSMSLPRPWIARPNERNNLARLQSSRRLSRCAPAIRSDKNRKLGGNRERRGGCDRFLWENQSEWFATAGWAREKDCRGR